MENKINLDKLETKVFSTTYQDGLLDMFLGIVLLQFAIGPLLTDIGFSDFAAAAAFIPVWLIALLLFFLIKRFITKPRIGTIKPGPVRKAKIVKANIILFVILFAGFLIGLLYEDFSQRINILFPLTFSMMILALASVSAYYFNIIRLYYYGILIAMAPLSGEIIEANTKLQDNPEIMNKDPYGEGWIVKIKIENKDELDSLMSSEEYEKLVKSESD